MPKARLTLLPLLWATYFMVSGGPFGIEDIVSKSGYAGALLILLLTPLVWSLPTALMVSELAGALPRDGGYYVWVSRAMGPFWGFQEAWLSLAGSVFDMAIYPTLFVQYLGHFLPAATAGHRGLWIGILLIAASAVWNLFGARSVGRGSVVMGILLLVPFAVLAALAPFHRVAASAHSVPLRAADVLGGILIAMWNYMGWDNASTVAGEVERPQRTYPLAMAGAVLVVAATYLIPVACLASTRLDPNRWSTGGWAVVASTVLPGSTGALVALAITATGLLSALGTQNALVMAYSRLPAVMAEDGYLPRLLARRSASNAPWVAVLACSAAWALCLGFSFTKLIALDVLLTGLSILLEFAALAVLRVREPGLPRAYRVPGGLAGTIAIAVCPVALLAVAALRNNAEAVGPLNALQFGAILILSGVPIYFLGKRIRNHDRR